MRSFSTLLSVALIVLSVSASSTIKLVRSNSARSLRSIVHDDRERASFMKARGSPGTTIIQVSNFNYSEYTASVGIGCPPTYYNLLVDTGSSNTWVGAGQKYVRTSSSNPTGQDFNITYGLGSARGIEYYDTVTLSNNIVIKNQSIGSANESTYFEGIDGILGVGPADLTVRTLSPGSNETIPTVLDNAYTQGLITKKILSVSFAPSAALNDTNGAMTLGGIDSSSYIGDIYYTPVTTTFPASKSWGVNVTRLMYGSQTIMNQSATGIVDTGTTQFLMIDDIFQEYISNIPGAYSDNVTSLLVIPKTSVRHMRPLMLQIGDIVLILDVAAQLFPKENNIGLGGTTDVRYGIVNSLGNITSSQHYSFLIGMTVMERYYTVFDAHKSRVGFAYTTHTFSSPEDTTNV